MLTCKYSKFSLPQRVTYLNCAYMAPLLKSVEKAGVRGVRLKRNPSEIRPEDFFAITRDLRKVFAKLINVKDADRIAIVPSASYGLAAVTRNLSINKGEHVLVAAGQFPSNYYPWQSLCAEREAEVRVVSPEDNFIERGKIWNEKILDAITPRTKAVALAHTHWADGTVFDLAEIRKRTMEVGALLVVDGTQSVGALPFDVEKIQPDALICAAYKWLLGPYSIGLAYYGEYFDGGKPVEENWINRLDSENFSSLVNYESRYQPAALRFNMGEQSNFILAPMATKAIEQISRWGVENIQSYCKSITELAVDTLRQMGFLIEELPWRASHLFGIRHSRQLDQGKLKDALARNRVVVSLRGDSIRVSPHLYNDEEDLARLVKILSTTV